MSSMTDVFGGPVVQPASVQYISYQNVSADLDLNWPFAFLNSSDVVAAIMEIDTTVAGISVLMPPADQVSVGQMAIVRNVGANSFDVKNNAGGLLFSVAPGIAQFLYVIDNTSPAGIWHDIQYGAGGSTFDADALAGYGLVALVPPGGPPKNLNTNIPYISINADINIDNTNRAEFINATQSLTIHLPVLGAPQGFYFWVANTGNDTAVVTIDSPALINGSSSDLLLTSGQKTLIMSDGTNWWTLVQTVSTGGGSPNGTVVVDVSAGGNITLTDAQASAEIITLVGNPTIPTTVLFPSASILQRFWFINNNASLGVALNVFGGSGSDSVFLLSGQSAPFFRGDPFLGTVGILPVTNISMRDAGSASPFKLTMFAHESPATGIGYDESVNEVFVAITGSKILQLQDLITVSTVQFHAPNVSVDDTTAASVGFGFGPDGTKTGLFGVGETQVGVSINQAQKAIWTPTSAEFSTPLALNTTSVATAPALIFGSPTDQTGLFLDTTVASPYAIGVSLGGSEIGRFHSAGLRITTAGSAAAPSLHFQQSGDQSGFWGYTSGPNNLMGVGITGTQVAAFSSQGIIVTGGSAPLPSYTFTDDSTSGFYSSGVGNVDVTIGGTNVVNINGTGVTITGSLTLSGAFAASTLQATSNGSAAAPSLIVSSDSPHIGFYRSASENLGVATNGAQVSNFSSQGLQVVAGSALLPSIANLAATTNGFYFSTGTSVDVAISATQVASFKPTGLALPNGAVGTPAFTFLADGTTGMYRTVAGHLGLAVGGAQIVDVSATGVSVTGNITLSGAFAASTLQATSNGTVGAPAIIVSSDSPQMGFYRTAAENLGVSANGIECANFFSGGLQLILGSAAAPSLTPLTSVTSGFYFPTNTSIGASISGTNVATINASGLLMQAGSSSVPAISFVGAPSSGFYSPAANQVGITANMVSAATFSSTRATYTVPIQLLNNAGSPTFGPSLYFSGDTLTGLANNPVTHDVQVIANNNLSGVFNTDGLILYNLGSLGTPALRLAQNLTVSTLGFYVTTPPDALKLSIGGATPASFSATGLNLLAGTAGSPSLTSGTDTTTGAYASATARFDIAVSGTKILEAAPTGVAITGTLSTTAGITATTLQLGNGAVGAPALTFAASANTGLYSAAAGSVNVATNGALAATFSSTNLAVVGSISAASASFTAALPIASGGTGQTTATAAFTALSPMTTNGDMIYRAAGAATRLPIGTLLGSALVTSAASLPAWSGLGILQLLTTNYTTQVVVAAFPTIVMSQNITTTNANSKVLIMATINVGMTTSADILLINLQRSGTPIFQGTGGGTGNSTALVKANSGQDPNLVTIIFLDTPGAAALYSYQINFASSTASSVRLNGITTGSGYGFASNIIVAEIGGF